MELERFRCSLFRAFYLYNYRLLFYLPMENEFRCSLFWAFYLWVQKLKSFHKRVSMPYLSFLFICRDSLHRKCNCFQCVSMLYQSFLFISKTNFDKIFNKVFRCSVFRAFCLLITWVLDLTKRVLSFDAPSELFICHQKTGEWIFSPRISMLIILSFLSIG